MSRKRSRPSPSTHLLAAAAFASSHDGAPQAFLMGSSMHCLHHRQQQQQQQQQRRQHSASRPLHHRTCSEASATSGSGLAVASASTMANSVVSSLRAVPQRRGSDLGDTEPDDPLPRTMEELYRRMRNNPPAEQQSEDEPVLQPQEIEFMEEAVRDVFRPMESDSWWEEHGEEWDRMAEDPASSFSVGVDFDDATRTREHLVWGMGEYFGEEGPEWRNLDEDAEPFSLTAYKAGITTKGTKEDISSTDGWFERTPFAEYWDSLPDLRVTKRVYGFNVVDRMAALKFMMNCTYTGMHGSAESHQSGHFLWGYVDQLDWMRRSGRLSSVPGSVKVDRKSWWGRVSFALTIAPLAAAVESGLWEEDAVSILDAEDLQLPEMRRAVRAWCRVWRFNDFDILSRVAMSMPVHDALQERVRRAQWAAHLESLDAVDSLYGKEFDGLPSSAEREFARGWCRSARLFAAAAAHTNIDRVLLPLGAGYPPERILMDDGCSGSGSHGRRFESIPYGPAHLVAEAEADPAVVVNTLRFVDSVRWLGSLRAPLFTALCILWQRACVSYPARRKAARVLRRACYGRRRAKVAAWGRSFLSMFVPDLNYRKLSPPFGVDPAEEVEYDPDMEPRDPGKRPPRPPGYRTSNPLQRQWYDGRRPTALTRGPDEDDDGIGDEVGGMFPPQKAPPDLSFEALSRLERDMAEKFKRVKEGHAERQAPEDVSFSKGGINGGRTDSGSGPNEENIGGAREAGAVDGDSAATTVFM